MSKPTSFEVAALPFASESDARDESIDVVPRALERGARVDVAPAPVARPTNYARSVLHVLSAAAALVALRVLPGRPWIIAASATLAITAWSMEISRRRSPAANERMMRMFGVFAHPHERHRVNSSTWYITALLLLSLVAPLRSAELGVLVLGLADPAAGFMGRRFGRTRIRANRSLEGTLSFLTVGALASLGWLSLVYAVTWPAIAVLAGAGALAGALVELFSTKLDDNFTIPVSVAAATAAAGLVLPFL